MAEEDTTREICEAMRRVREERLASQAEAAAVSVAVLPRQQSFLGKLGASFSKRASSLRLSRRASSSTAVAAEVGVAKTAVAEPTALALETDASEPAPEAVSEPRPLCDRLEVDLFEPPPARKTARSASGVETPPPVSPEPFEYRRGGCMPGRMPSRMSACAPMEHEHGNLFEVLAKALTRLLQPSLEKCAPKVDSAGAVKMQ